MNFSEIERIYNPMNDPDFTPTFGEFLWSFVKLPGHILMGPSTEDLFYFNLHMVHFGAHYSWHASRVGAYAAWDTFAGWRMFQRLKGGWMTTPTGLIAATTAIGVASAVELHSDSTTLDLVSSLGGGYTGGSTQRKKIASLGGFGH
jgi:hypothetical protein